MLKKLILMAFVGAIVAQLWGTVSWMLCSWHSLDYREFKNGAIVKEVIKSQIQESGIYMLPNFNEDVHTDPSVKERWFQESASGPVAFMAIKRDGIEPGMGKPMAIGFLMNILIAGALFFVVCKLSLQSLFSKAVYSGGIATIGASFPYISNWSWWNFPTIYTFAGIADMFVTWFFAGLVMAFISKKFSK